MDMDVETLQKELQTLREQRFEASGRLRELNQRGRGRGRGGFGRAGFGGIGGISGRGNFSGRGLGDEQGPGMENSTSRVRSAVVLKGRESIGRSDFIPPVLTKRPASSDLDKDQNLKKRNRRMFGALLGTLQKFSEEDQIYQQSTIAQRRSEAMQKAEERKVHDSQILKQKAIEEVRKKRETELNRLWDLDLQAKLKVSEILYANKIKRHTLFLHCIQTKTEPRLYWTPGKHNEDTQKMVEAEKEKFEKWKVEQSEKLEAEKKELIEQDAERRKERMKRQSNSKNNGNENLTEENQQETEEKVEKKDKEEIKKDKTEGPKNEEDGELPYDAQKDAEEQQRIEEEIAAEGMAQADDLLDDIA